MNVFFPMVCYLWCHCHGWVTMTMGLGSIEICSLTRFKMISIYLSQSIVWKNTALVLSPKLGLNSNYTDKQYDCCNFLAFLPSVSKGQPYPCDLRCPLMSTHSWHLQYISVKVWLQWSILQFLNISWQCELTLCSSSSPTWQSSHNFKSGDLGAIQHQCKLKWPYSQTVL